jgi:hypothetical protein
MIQVMEVAYPCRKNERQVHRNEFVKCSSLTQQREERLETAEEITTAVPVAGCYRSTY